MDEKEKQVRWVSYVSSPARREREEEFFSVLEEYTPEIEEESGGAYLELSGVRRILGHPFTVISRIGEEFSRRGLRASFGLGPSKLIARAAAAGAGEGEVFWVIAQGARSFLDDLPVKNWPGLEGGRAEELAALGITRLGELARIDPYWIRRVWGEKGTVLWNQARGFDPRPVVRKLPRPAAPPLPGLFPPSGKEEKKMVLRRVARYLRRRYGRGGAFLLIP